MNLALTEGVNQLAGELDADDTTAEHEHIHVVVLHALMRRVGVVAQAGANAGNPVCGHRCADAAAAEHDAALHSRFANRLADGFSVVRVVHRILAVGTHVEHFMILLDQKGFHLLLEVESGVI